MADDDGLSARSYVSLISFFVCIYFCVAPLDIRLPKWCPLQTLRIDLGSAPVICVLFELATTVMSPDVVRLGILGSNGIQPWAIVVLFFSLAYVSISIDLTGLFSFIAFQVTKRGKGNGRKLYDYLFMLSVLLTIFTSNDVVVLTVTPILCYLGIASHIDVSAFTLSSFIVCNIASMMLYIGNPTNVVVAQASNINFIQFTAVMGIPTIVGIITAYFATKLLISHLIPRNIQPPPSEAEHTYALKDRNGAIFGVGVLLSCLVCLMVVPLFTDVGVWLLTAPFGLLMLVKDVFTDLKRTRSSESERNSLSMKEMSDVKSHDRNNSSVHRNSLPYIQESNTVDAAAPAMLQVLHDSGHINNSQHHELTALANEETESAPPDGTMLEQDIAATNINNNGKPPKSPQTLSPPSIKHSEANQTEPPRTSITKPNYLLKRLPITYTAISRCPWRIGPFALGMFVLVESLNALNWTAVLAIGIARICQTVPAAIFAIGFLSALACSLLNNLPMTILAVRILQHPNFSAGVGGDAAHQQQIYQAALWGLVVGSNIGADLTFVASLAGLMWSELLKMHPGMEMKQWRFAKLCVGVMVVSLTASLTPTSPYGNKVKIVLAEKGLPFTVKPTLPFGLTVSPKQEVPYIEDGPVLLTDSRIICEYLDEKYTQHKMMPSDPLEKAKLRAIIDVVDSQLEGINWGLGEILFWHRAGTEGQLRETLLANAKTSTDNYMIWLSTQLGDKQWFGGSMFSLADAAVVSHMIGTDRMGFGPAASTPIGKWWERAKQRKAVAAILAEKEAVATDGGKARREMLYEKKAFRRQYRDHRLEFMIRSGGISVVEAGIKADNIRFTEPEKFAKASKL
ncbi:hypothetical protein SmJEL517_g01172 [Synchytrium microbalum]|uniref:Citrate transporter-like domain-containing protein n=1 Tax=Synchytrium microbalum TaxID=1806994 RepID=A0A507C6E4_9FUNG|nr:uncharacterized protein SmJEL517_g01172 [Synchytrium microbalum]TPX36607.1 hypothetical protein SmJEL517_g01172 [Synchytrium microbalum]